jgi:hypothetical protein
MEPRHGLAALDQHLGLFLPKTHASELSRSDTIDEEGTSSTTTLPAWGLRMAIYRFEAKIVKRSAGRSATATAAYRAGAFIRDERTGLAFDYSRKRGVLIAEIMAPPDAPEWVSDRAKLWNAIELAEKRKDAQLARDLALGLPFELTNEERFALVREFVGETFVARGMIADVAIHAPDHRGDDRNHHAHILLTLRRLEGGAFGPKVREWNETAELEGWRAAWADAVNRHLARAGHEARVDHRSLTDQGIDREPEPKQGAVATAMERDGQTSFAGDDRRAAKERNRRRKHLAGQRAEVIDELEADGWSDPDAFRSKPVRKAAGTGWARYLIDLWRQVALSITRPIVTLAKATRRKIKGRRRSLKKLG